MRRAFKRALSLDTLIGMITRNSVVLIDQIDLAIEEKGRIWRSVIDSTGERLRPVLATAIRTVLGTLPIIRKPVWPPLTFTVVGSLEADAALTPVSMPVLYFLRFRTLAESNSTMSGALTPPWSHQ